MPALEGKGLHASSQELNSLEKGLVVELEGGDKAFILVQLHSRVDYSELFVIQLSLKLIYFILKVFLLGNHRISSSG